MHAAAGGDCSQRLAEQLKEEKYGDSGSGLQAKKFS